MDEKVMAELKDKPGPNAITIELLVSNVAPILEEVTGDSIKRSEHHVAFFTQLAECSELPVKSRNAVDYAIRKYRALKLQADNPNGSGPPSQCS
jgi:hypothetical protein